MNSFTTTSSAMNTASIRLANDNTMAQWHLFGLRELFNRQPALAAVTLICVLATLPMLIAMQVDSRTVNDISGWVKPVKFLLSLAVFYATLGWYFGYLPRAIQTTRRGRFIIWGAVSTGALEMIWLILAAVVGVPSHFNHTTMLWTVAYGMAGAGATVLLLCMLLQGRLIARDRSMPLAPAFRQAIAVGTGLAFITTLVVAFYLASGSGHWVGSSHSDAHSLPLLDWSRTTGDLRVAHFFALHAQQVVPFAGWLLVKTNFAQPTRWVSLAAVLYLGLIVFTFVQALQGQPFIS